MGQHYLHERLDRSVESSTLVRKKDACAIKRILDRDTHEVVGWLYEWNTGEIGVMWMDGPRKHVVYV